MSTQLHEQLSHIKSLIRILGYALLPVNIVAAMVLLLIGEVVGIAEELFGT